MSTDPLFRMTVEDVFSIKGRGTVVTGKIEAGTLSVGDQVFLRGEGYVKKIEVTGLEMFRKLLDQAKAGDAVGVLLGGISRDDVSRGDVLLGSEIDFSWKP